jgi:hypothetical protein
MPESARRARLRGFLEEGLDRLLDGVGRAGQFIDLARADAEQLDVAHGAERESFDADDEAYEESAASYVICVTFCAFGVPLRAKGLGVTPER